MDLLKMVLSYLKKIYRIINPTGSIKVLKQQKKRSPALTEHYFADTKIHKLHIGCQDSPIPGWLNIDIEPTDKRVVYMDATKPFPFADHSFKYVYSEHMIEHISIQEGLLMVRECYRVLEHGGVIRISTPDLKFLIQLYNEDKTEVQKRYINSYKKFYKDFTFFNDTFVINHFVRSWGHQFIYDKKTMQALLENAGFEHIHFCVVGESAFRELQNIEQHGRVISDDFNKLESLIVEAVKP